MPLTHVSILSNQEWKKITAEEAAKLYPYGIPAQKGIFRCDLCGQYVTLTYGTIRAPYFKHSSAEKSKDCPERTFANGNYISTSQEYELPIKIDIKSNDRFQLNLGFFSVPSALTETINEGYIVIEGENNKSKFQYSLDRIGYSGITYLSVGDIPCKTYRISYTDTGNAQELQKYWPPIVHGISADGTLFDKETGKKISTDSDVSVGHTYYLVTKRIFIHDKKNISCRLICSSSEVSNSWYVYEIQATILDESTYEFFLDFHARLTDKPVEFYPIWPEFIESPYQILHREDGMYFYLKGQEVKAFPTNYIKATNITDADKIVCITCHDRQQLVTANRTTVLKFSYLWKDDLIREVNTREPVVININGKLITPRIYNKPPINDQILINCESDGFVEIDDLDDFPISRYYFSAGDKLPIDNIKYGTVVNIYYGLDCVWTARFEKQERESIEDEQEIINRLESYQDDYIKIPHALGSFAITLKDRPLLFNWFCIQVKKGRISRSALNLLKTEGVNK